MFQVSYIYNKQNIFILYLLNFYCRLERKREDFNDNVNVRAGLSVRIFFPSFLFFFPILSFFFSFCEEILCEFSFMSFCSLEFSLELVRMRMEILPQHYYNTQYFMVEE